MIREMLRVRKEYQSARIELLDFKDRSTQARVEIAMLKAKLHRTRLRLAAPEAAMIKAEGMRTGLTLTVQQLAAEADEVKNEDESLTKAVETEEANPQEERPTSHEECSEHATSEACEEENAENEAEAQITISLEEYKALTVKAKKVDDIPVMPAEATNNHEVQALKRDLEIAQAKVGEFRSRVVQAITRAEAAERSQALAEDQLRSWRERKQQRKAALVALQEGLVSQESPTPPYEEMTSSRTSPLAPLGEVLNLRCSLPLA
ncbi:hypothetical protein MLD38_025000 [Melastoma candidum]|nr:hypothetical protein MLD38_025000 [Melastoma candidum]